jgi:hypothetical protein
VFVQSVQKGVVMASAGGFAVLGAQAPDEAARVAAELLGGLGEERAGLALAHVLAQAFGREREGGEELPADLLQEPDVRRGVISTGIGELIGFSRYRPEAGGRLRS